MKIIRNKIINIIAYLITSLENIADKHNFLPELAKCCQKNNSELASYFYKKYLKSGKYDINEVIKFARFLTAKDKMHQSIRILDEALKTNHDNINLLLLMCQNFLKLKDYKETVNCAKYIIKLDINQKYAYKFLCDAYFKLGLYQELLKSLHKIMEFDIDNINIKIDIANYLCYLNLKDEALKYTDNNFDLSSIDKDKIGDITNIYLKFKEMKKGMYGYNKVMQSFSIPYVIYHNKLWNGENLENKTLFIFNCSVDMGNHIMYSRYIPILAKKAAKLIIEVNKNLYELYKYNFPDCEIILQDSKMPDFDYTYHHNLFLNLQKNLDVFPFPDGYLKVEKKLAEQMEKLEIFNTDKLKVGIFYKSNTTYIKNRSIELAQIIPILKKSNCKFYAIGNEKKTNEDIEILNKYNVIDCAKYIKDANDTAAIMKNLDIVISIDSFPIHLAGALGVKSFLMLPFDAEWRWFFETEKTAWYNNVRIFKQTIPEKWEEVIQKITNELG